jgi:hypothetical protein
VCHSETYAPGPEYCTFSLQVSILSIVIVSIWSLQDKVHTYVAPSWNVQLLAVDRSVECPTSSLHCSRCKAMPVTAHMFEQGIRIVKNIPKGLPGFTANEWFPLDGSTSKASPNQDLPVSVKTISQAMCLCPGC